MTDAPLITEEFINRLIEYSEDLGQKLEPWQVLKLREYMGKPFPDDVASGAYLTGLRKAEETGYADVGGKGYLPSLTIQDELVVTPDTSKPGWDADIQFEDEMPQMEILEQGGPEVPLGGRRTPSGALSSVAGPHGDGSYPDAAYTGNRREPLNRAERRLAAKQARRKR
jgi:hypothetical protein